VQCLLDRQALNALLSQRSHASPSSFAACRGLHLAAPTAGCAGHRLLSCSADGQLRLHSQSCSGGWRLEASWAAPGPLTCLASLRGASHAACGGEGREVAVYDVETQQPLFQAKPPAKDWLGMYVKIFCASAAFTGDGGHATLLVGGEREARLFDFRAQRRAVRTFPLGARGLVSALAPSVDGRTFVAGSTAGLLSQFDVASGRAVGAMKGCSGAVRCAAQHPTLPLVAVTGLDRHVRVFSTRSRAQLCGLYVKQQCTGLAFDLSGGDSAPLEAAAAAGEGEVAPRRKKRSGRVIQDMAEQAQRMLSGEEEQPRKERKKPASRRDEGMVLNIVQ